MNSPECQPGDIDESAPPARPAPAAAATGPAAGSDDWREEMQRRVERYRKRRQRLDPAAPQILSFPAPPRPTPMVAVEPVAGPVVLPRLTARTDWDAPPAPAMDRPPEAPPPPAWTLTAPPPAMIPVIPEWPAPGELAAPVRPLAERRAARRAAPPRGPDPAGFIQIALPIAAAAPRTAPEPEFYPVARRSLRLQAGLTDAWIIAAASAGFGLVAWAVAGFALPDIHTPRHLLAAMVMVPALMTMLYVFSCFYAGDATVGMRAAGLCVWGFDGPVTRAQIRRRAAASVISLAALGLGYAWIWCDSHQLTWHDYISRTLVAEADRLPQ